MLSSLVYSSLFIGSLNSMTKCLTRAVEHLFNLPQKNGRHYLSPRLCVYMCTCKEQTCLALLKCRFILALQNA
uniref:Uncharacterized protein n=1 Tax=Rhizophora mucronata TaxID=61149 RepID=A0A2P2N4A1_RHIMU